VKYTAWLGVWMAIYVGALTFIASSQRLRKFDVAEYFASVSRPFGTLALSISFAATLYSAFFMIGIPGFMFAHGIGAWPYVILGDILGVLVLYAMGRRFLQLHTEYVRERNLDKSDLSSPLRLLSIGDDTLITLAFVGTVSAFMVPYLALQLAGIGRLIEAATGGWVSSWIASATALLLIWIYSTVAGVRGIVISDFLQGCVLFTLLAGLGFMVLFQFGGPEQLVWAVRQVEPALLSLPGPSGFFTFTTMLSFFFVVALIPISQPQFLTRYLLFSPHSDNGQAKVRPVAFGMGWIFAVLSIPVIFIGLGGAAAFYGAVTGDAVVNAVLSEWTAPWFASLFTVAVICAAMSTSDSVLFSIAQMISQDIAPRRRFASSSSTNSKHEISAILLSRAFVLIIGVLAFGLSLVSAELVLKLGQLAFSGCVIVVPFLILGFFFRASLITLRISLYTAVIGYVALFALGLAKVLGFDASLWSALVAFVAGTLHHAKAQSARARR